MLSGPAALPLSAPTLTYAAGVIRRSPGERANAQLKTWRILRKLRCCPGQAGQLAKAIHIRQARQTQG